MTEDIEERFRAACSAYLTAAETLDIAKAGLEDAATVVRTFEQAADRARDELLQVVRERDLAAQLDAAGPPVPVIAVIGPDGRDTGATIVGGRIVPSPRVQAAADEFRARYLPDVHVVDPEDTDRWRECGGICPECGISWREESPGCPHLINDWHPR